ncbi:MAG TPA: ROK family protein [Acidobacteriaceae bacterium]|jgi:predicted NBD/HSP70 family sugar kinase
MGRSIGVVMTTDITAGLIEDHRLIGEIRRYPEDPDEMQGLIDLPTDPLVEVICDLIMALKPEKNPLDAIGIALPGIVRAGVVEDSPNLAQLKGARISQKVEATLHARGIKAPISLFNDADASAAGLAATRNQLDKVVRVWTLGNGIGFGRYPDAPGPFEGGHTVVTLDPKETFCGCNGVGHLEGIVGHRAMRLRFMDMEPDEIFANAKKGDQRCADFVKRWHRALAAGTATSIHLEGPGRFYLTGTNIGFLDLALLKQYLWDMVKMSPLQSYSVESIPETPEIAVIGAGTAAELDQKR